jgi:two-component system sensor histidine kinase QseC
MTSLRRRLLTGLCAGLAVVWLVGGLSVFVAVSANLQARFDAELSAIATEVRFLLPENRTLQETAPGSFWMHVSRPGSGLYFEVWDDDLLFSDRSPNLGRNALPQPAAFADTPRFWNHTMPDGERVRIIAQRHSLPSAATTGSAALESAVRQMHHVVVARNRDSLDVARRLLLAAITFSGLLILPVSLLIVRYAVGKGLSPLGSFADRVAALHSETLHERIDNERLPSELKPIAVRLNELLERLQAGILRERRLNADLAHELRTPAAELMTMAEVALAWPDRIEAAQFQNVLDAARQMQSVIERMLMLARWESGGRRPDRKPVPVAGAVADCLARHEHAVATRRHRVAVDIRDDLVLETHPELFDLILANLVSNAIAHSPDESLLSINATGGPGGFSLAVSNPAPDFLHEDLPYVFERFWRQDHARRATGHAGLGLSLAKTAADLLELRIEAALSGNPQTFVMIVSSRRPNGVW